MIRIHRLEKLEKEEIDLDGAIRGHCADQVEVYKRVNGEPLCAGFYLPKETGRHKRPLFVFIHGGGWSSHKIFDDQPTWQGDHLGYLARYFAEKGFVCASIDYRLIRDNGQAEGYGIIDCYEDCCDAMDYVTAQGEKYDIDPEERYLLGESAGGQLAGGLAVFGHDRRYSFRKVFLVNPITYFPDNWSFVIPMHSSHPRLKGLSYEERAVFLSPLCRIHEGVSETVLLHGEEDATVRPEHSLKFHERMLEVGAGCQLHLLRQTKHGFLLAEYTANKEACRRGIRIIEDCVNERRSSPMPDS